jgi:rod shape-determining protein mreD
MPSLVAAFLIGLCIDIFSNTGGLHAASSVLIAYLRNPILLTVFGKNFEYQELDLLAYPFSKIFSYTTLMVVVHHTLFYFLEVFNFNHLFLTLAKIVGASIFTIIVCLLFIYLFSKNKK